MSRFITPLARLSFPHLVTPQPGKNGQKPKYSASFVFTPELLADPLEKDRLAAIQQAGVEAINAKWPGQAADLLSPESQFKKGFRRDWKQKNYPEGSIFFTARSVNKPGCVTSIRDPKTKKPTTIPDDKLREVLYPGAVVRGLITVFTYEQEGSKGLTFGLEGIQFVEDAPRMDGRVAAEDAFEADLSEEPASLEDLMKGLA